MLQIHCAVLSTHPPANPVQGLPRLQAIVRTKYRGNSANGWENQSLTSPHRMVPGWRLPAALPCRPPWLAAPPGREAMGSCPAGEQAGERLGGSWWFRWPPSRHYSRDSPRARLSCPRVTRGSAAVLCAQPAQLAHELYQAAFAAALWGGRGEAAPAAHGEKHTLFLLFLPCCGEGRGRGGLLPLSALPVGLEAGGPAGRPAGRAHLGPALGGEGRPAAVESCGRERLLPGRGNAPLLQRGRQRWAEPAEEAVRVGRSWQPARVVENVGRWVPH